jgi:hypothetical protein
LVVGSIPTRPTNRFKRLASPSGGASSFLGACIVASRAGDCNRIALAELP